jgi:II/X family phage/plasmid replication protein
MIDWISCSFPYRSRTVMDEFVKRSWVDGEFQPGYTKGIDFKGSYSATLRIMATGSQMSISGNPVKWLSGQNVVGINCIKTLIRETYAEVLKLMDLPDCLAAQRALRAGHVDLTRVDCTFAYKVGSDEDVVAWLMAMESACHVKHRGRGHYRGSMCSLMFGLIIKEGEKPKGSRRSSFKFYNKLRTCSKLYHDELKQIATGIVRGEALFRGLELRDLGLSKVHQWTLKTPYDLHKRWINNMDIAESVRLKTEDELILPRSVLSTYMHWKNAVDVKEILSKPTFYRHRKMLLEHGIDIAIAPRDIDGPGETVIPVLRVLEAEPVDESDHEELFWRLRGCA